jgi:RNA polymerase sigma factor (sigma-70 family)
VDDYEQFFREHYARVVASLRLAGGDAGDSEDAAQEAFAKAMLRWKSVSVMGRPATWVYVVAIRELRRRRRDPWPSEERVVNEATLPDHASTVATETDIERAVQSLPPRQRLAVVLRFHADLTVPEVSRAMRCSEGTVKSTLHSALDRLRSRLGDSALERVNDGR